MDSYRKLIKPTKDIVTIFNGFWEEKPEVQEIELFADETIRYKIVETIIPGINSFKDGDELLKTVFEKLRGNDYTKYDVEIAVFLLDSIYHTYLRNHIQTANKLFELLRPEKGLLTCLLGIQADISSEDNDAIECVDAIARINENKDKKLGTQGSLAATQLHYQERR